MQLPSNKLDQVLATYQKSFSDKQFADVPQCGDVLMDAFNITADLKHTAMQYWSRELGMCWERIVRDLFSSTVETYGPVVRTDFGEPCDFTACGRAVDTKYRLGSGDSGTLRKLASNAVWLRSNGFRPTMLILRPDSLPGAIAHMRKAGWDVMQGPESFDFIKLHTHLDLAAYLAEKKGAWPVDVSRSAAA